MSDRDRVKETVDRINAEIQAELRREGMFYESGWVNLALTSLVAQTLAAAIYEGAPLGKRPTVRQAVKAIKARALAAKRQASEAK